MGAFESMETLSSPTSSSPSGKQHILSPSELSNCERDLRSSKPGVREAALTTLRAFNGAGSPNRGDRPIDDEVMELLEDEYWGVRRAAVRCARTLRMHEDKMEVLAQKIAYRLEDEVALVRLAAAETMGDLGQFMVPHAGYLLQLTSEKDAVMKATAVEA